jgi:cell division protease FtsH
MSKKMGPMVYGENENEVFLGRSVTQSKNISEKTMQEVDAEVRRILDEQYAIAYKILDENRDKMHTMAHALIEWETIDRDQVLEIMAGKQPSPPKDFSENVVKDAEVEQPVAEAATASTDSVTEAVSDAATKSPESEQKSQK